MIHILIHLKYFLSTDSLVVIRQVPDLESSGLTRMIRSELRSLTELYVICNCFKYSKEDVRWYLSTVNGRPGESFPEELMLALRSGVGVGVGVGVSGRRNWEEPSRQREQRVGGSGAFEELGVWCAVREQRWMKIKGGGRWDRAGRANARGASPQVTDFDWDADEGFFKHCNRIKFKF